MKIVETTGLTQNDGRFDAQHTADSIDELEEQIQRGDIEQAAYLIKKRSLVRLYLKATTTPQRKTPGLTL